MATQAFAQQVLIEATRGREQARQAAAGEPLLMQAGDQTTQVARVQLAPGVQAFGFTEGLQLAEVATIAVEGVRRHLALAAQVFEVGVEVGFKLQAASSK